MASAHLEFSELAEQDLTDIALFIAARNPVRALSFVAELRGYCARIAESPQVYRLREEYGAGVRVAPHGRYLIFFAERTAGKVVIERILHGARHLAWVEL